MYKLINSMATLDLTPIKSRTGNKNLDVDSEAEDLGLYMHPIKETLSTCEPLPERTLKSNNERNGRADNVKPSFRSKSLRVKSEGRVPLRAYLDTHEEEDKVYNGVTVTQPKRNLSPSEQLTLMQRGMFRGSQPPPVPATVMVIMRVKSEDRYDRYRDILSFNSPRDRISEERVTSKNGGYTRSAKSSSSGSDSDFSIPRPKLIVPVHTYGTRKRRTGNLCQRDSTATESSLDAGILLDVTRLEDKTFDKHENGDSVMRVVALSSAIAVPFPFAAEYP
ncbi:unnamed protein product [Euphydryas editha]|uniref:Neurotrophin-3 n=1 Tax=Euphydryas editha TaxID=104508 RepID=A0AAU9U285_EUPED|nr:unnamed protein product [Euphydryas editha]